MAMTVFRTMWKAVTCRPCTLILLVLLLLAAGDAYAGIGEEARSRAAEAPAIEKDPKQTQETVLTLMNVVKLLALVLVVLAIFLASRLSRLVDYDPFRKWNANTINGAMFGVFGLLFGAFVYYQWHHYAKLTILETASVHGQGIDTLFNITLIGTGIVFILVQGFIFYYASRYRRTSTSRALYYPDNHKLELIWTLVPALALAVVVLYGVSVWNQIHYPDLAGKKPVHIEMVAEQFKWTIRYGGEDNKLGKADYKLINSTNSLGMDSTDKANHDDKLVITSELHVPVNTPITLHARSKDVLHGMFIPHFAVNVYAVPGMPTEFTFTPTKTTEQMRLDTGNPKFNYELACGQLCGSGHWNMRVIVIVEDEKAYGTWLASQQAWMAPKPVADEKKEGEGEKKDAKEGPTAQNNTDKAESTKNL